jgi:hypothetical protein
MFLPLLISYQELARSLAPRLCEEVPVCVLTLLALPGLPMGCASSKDDKADASPTDVNPAVGGSAAHKGPTTHTGYHSDVEAGQKHAFTEQLVTNNMHQIGEIYDLSHSTTLGRGACGSVSTVTHKATGAIYAMKTVSMEGMAAHTMAELRQEIAVQKMLDHPNIVRHAACRAASCRRALPQPSRARVVWTRGHQPTVARRLTPDASFGRSRCLRHSRTPAARSCISSWSCARVAPSCAYALPLHPPSLSLVPAS